jgi:hypothetical protein
VESHGELHFVLVWQADDMQLKSMRTDQELEKCGLKQVAVQKVEVSIRN